MNQVVKEALARCFDEKRVVFWYDEGGKCRAEFDEIELSEVDKLVIDRNEFGIKYKILIEKPEGKFLVYSPNARPYEAEDWLLDLYLTAAHFSTDPATMIISEMQFPDTQEMRLWLTEQTQLFFRSAQRKNEVKSLLEGLGHPPTINDVLLSLMCVVCRVRTHMKIEYVLSVLLKELAEDKTDSIDELAKYGLESALWTQLSLNYGYQNESSPSIVDFANKLFHDAFYPAIREERYQLSHAALSFFNDWKNSVKSRETFKVLSKAIARKLDVAKELATVPIENFGALDVFREIDEQIVKALVEGVERGSSRVDDVIRLIGQRKDGCYWADFASAYEAIESAVRFFALLSTTDLSSSSVEDAINKYAHTWYQIDQQYRLFLEYYNQATKEDDALIERFAVLKEKIDGCYVNNYLVKQSVNFQEQLKKKANWEFEGVKSQLNFWNDWIVPAGMTVCVIISDALRYEVGEELTEAIEGTRRYLTKITPMVSTLPSYTQLGMAALLPHKKLDLAGGQDGKPSEFVYADGKLTNGLERRKAILENLSTHKATAISYDEVMSMTRDKCRQWQSSATVLYVYHNILDERGDRLKTEGETPAAAREAINEITKLIAKIAGDYRITKFIVTSDHGFLYQDRELDDSQYVNDEECICRAEVRKSRFVMGWPLAESQVLANYKSEQLGLEPGADIRIAKGIMRMRKQGCGVRFVHGGASLQEIVVPVVEIQHVKSDKADVVPVEAEILVDGVGRITTNRFNVSIYQTSPVGEKFKKRIVRLSLRTLTGELLSDEVQLVLDSEAKTVQDRTKSTMLTLNRAANEMGSGSVVLKMETGNERRNGNVDFDVYKEKAMTLRLAITNFFD